MTVDDAKSAINLIADDLEMYQDDSLVETLLGGFQDFLDGPARVRQLTFWDAGCIALSLADATCPPFHSRST